MFTNNEIALLDSGNVFRGMLDAHVDRTGQWPRVTVPSGLEPKVDVSRVPEYKILKLEKLEPAFSFFLDLAVGALLVNDRVVARYAANKAWDYFQNMEVKDPAANPYDRTLMCSCFRLDFLRKRFLEFGLLELTNLFDSPIRCAEMGGMYPVTLKRSLAHGQLSPDSSKCAKEHLEGYLLARSHAT
jgi:hypothetical protein